MCTKATIALILTACCTTVDASQIFRCQTKDGSWRYQSLPCAGQTPEKSEYKVRGYASGSGQATVPSGGKQQLDTYLQNRKADNEARNRAEQISTKQQKIDYLRGENDSLRRKMNVEIAALRNQGSNAANNLAGATYVGGLGTQMQAVSNQYSSQIASNDAQITLLQSEIAALQKAGG